MAWRKWKLGLLISAAAALLSAGAGLTAGMGWRPFIAVFCVSTLTHCGAYLKNHPIETVEDQNGNPNPPAR